MRSPARDAARAVWESVRSDTFPDELLEIVHEVAILPSFYDVGTLATASVALAALANAVAHAKREPVTIDARHAQIAFRSEQYLRIDGNAPEMWAPLSGDYRTVDASFVRLHANYPQHQRAIGKALNVPLERAAIEAAVASQSAVAVEEAVLAAGGAAGALRSRDAWRASEAGRSVSDTPLISIERIDDAPEEALRRRARVVDLTRVISGPLCGKVLASAGYDVIRFGTPALPDADALIIDTGFGKRFTDVDLNTPRGHASLQSFVRDADVVVQSHRPGSLARRGFGAEHAAQLRPGIVYVSISAYGSLGPFAMRRGFDSIVQLVTGLADEPRDTAPGAKPVPLPAQALDHATGWLAAFAVMSALARRSREGGSWRIDLSLARTAEWLASLDIVPSFPLPKVSGIEDVDYFLDRIDSEFGRLTFVRSPMRESSQPNAPTRSQTVSAFT